MRFKAVHVFTLAAVLSSPIFAQEAAPEAAAEEPQVDPQLEEEIAYVEALVNSGFPDFATPVIEATKKKWPEAEVRFFAIEIRGMLALQKFDEAEKLIAALPDRKSTKYWAARLQVANSYNVRNMKDKCREIYSEFFKTFPKPKKDLLTFYMESSYAWAQILVGDKRFEEAAEVYNRLLQSPLKLNQKCMVSCETIEIYTRLASQLPDKEKKKRDDYLAKADKLAMEVLKHPDQPIYFGRAVSMKAHVVLLKGNVQEAQDIIEEFLPTLIEIHENIVNFDPDGKQGLLKMSPLPQCRFLLAEMLWQEAQKQYAKPKHDDDAIKDMLFGAKTPSGKRNGLGAYNHALNVFLKNPECSWAPKAGELSDAIENFAIEKYKAKIAKKVTPEMIARVLAEQFNGAQEKIDSGDVQAGIDEYYGLLAQYPETINSLGALESIAKGYHRLILQEKNEALKAEYRLNCDVIEHYLAERFSGLKDKSLMREGGNSTLRMAALEKELGQLARAAELRKAFVINYRAHPTAAQTAAGMAAEAQAAEQWRDAIALYDILGQYYTNSTFYVSSYLQRSLCYGKLGERKSEIEMMKEYVNLEAKPVLRLGCQMLLAQMYQKDGFDMLKSADDIQDPEEANKTIARGCASIVRGIQQFQDFSKQIDGLLADPNVPAPDKEKYTDYKETATFIVGESWSRMKKPEAKVSEFRKKAVEGIEAYVAAYPKGKYTAKAYVKLSMLYTALGNMDGSKSALDRLAKAFPDSEEAKNAKPALAKSFVEMGLKKEGTEIYAEMLRTDGAYSANQFLAAGEALIDAKSWDLANQAYERAIRLAGTNSVTTIAKARIGLAKTAWKQGSLVEAREALDLFLADEKMSKMGIAADANFMLVEIASEQGRNEKDDQLRGKCFGAALGALKKVRKYWAKKPQYEQDQLDLLAGDVLVNRMQAEEAMGLKEAAMDTCGRAAAHLQAFHQAHGVSAARPLDKMSAGELANLERCYETMLPLFSKLGPEQAERVIQFGQQYLDLFPNGKKRTDVANFINKARVEMPANVSETPAAPVPPAAE